MNQTNPIEAPKRFNSPPFHWASFLFSLGSLSACVPLAVYAYLGTFSRYLADDYCASSYLYASRNLLDATLLAYSLWANSYSRLMFSQLIELGGTNGIRAMAGTELVIWALLLAWMFYELGKLMQARLPKAAYLWLAGAAIALSLYQTSALYQILYWRTGVIPYSLPLLWFIGIAAFFLRYVGKPYEKSRAVWFGILFAILIFFAGGLSETTSGMLVGIMFIAVALAWRTKRLHQRRDVVTSLIVGLIVAIIAISITAASPGTSNRLHRIMRSDPIYNPIELAGDVILYTSQALFETIRSYPSLAIVALVLSFCVIFLALSTSGQNAARLSPAHLRWALLIIPIAIFVIIGFSYAPSAFVRTFPAARARFASLFVLTLGLIFEGGIVGVLAAQARSFTSVKWTKVVVAFALIALLVHPLRITPKIYALRYEYQKFSQQWDARDTLIRQAVADGKTDLVVVQLDSIGGVGEYKGNPKDWINLCAARFYGLNSIVAP